MAAAGDNTDIADYNALAAASILKPVCRLTQTAGQGITDATTTALIWDTELEDTHAMHTGSSSQVIIPTGYDGLYLCFATFIVPAATDYLTIGVVVAKNTVQQAPWQRFGPNATSASRTVQTVVSVRCVAGDILETYVFQDNSANTSRTTPAGGSFACVFEVHYQRQ